LYFKREALLDGGEREHYLTALTQIRDEPFRPLKNAAADPNTHPDDNLRMRLKAISVFQGCSDLLNFDARDRSCRSISYDMEYARRRYYFRLFLLNKADKHIPWK